MRSFDVESFRQRVRQARTVEAYQQLQDELRQHVNSLSADEKAQLQTRFKSVWGELNSRVDTLIDEIKRLDRPVTA